MSTPRDALFRDTFSDPVHAAGQLRSVLPAAFVAQCDWDTLALDPGSFVDESLRATQSDLLYRVRVATGGEVLVYVLLEHQSRTDALMAYRLLAYMVRIWERWLREHEGAVRLPMIVPVVVHHGRSAWSAPVAFEALVEIPDESLAKHVPSFAFVLDDLTAQSDDVIASRTLTALASLVLFALKHSRSREPIGTVVARLLGPIVAVAVGANGVAALSHVMWYSRKVRPEVAREVVAQMSTETMPRFETMDEIKALFREIIGPVKSVDEARREGKSEGERHALLTVLTARFGTLPDEIATRVNTATTDECMRLLARAAVAPSLADAFAAD